MDHNTEVAHLSSSNIDARGYEQTAFKLLRISLIIIFFVFAAHKPTVFEAEGIAPLIVNSPFTLWLSVFGTVGSSIVVGIAEVTFGLLLAAGLWRPGSYLAIGGALGSIVTYLVTLSFLLTTPKMFAPDGPPFLSPLGQFLIKDIVLLAASALLLANDLAIRNRLAIGQRRWI